MVSPKKTGQGDRPVSMLAITAPSNQERVDNIISGISYFRDSLDQLDSLVVTLGLALSSPDLSEQCQDMAVFLGVLRERIDELDQSAKGMHLNLVALLDAKEE